MLQAMKRAWCRHGAGPLCRYPVVKGDVAINIRDSLIMDVIMKEGRLLDRRSFASSLDNLPKLGPYTHLSAHFQSRSLFFDIKV